MYTLFLTLCLSYGSGQCHDYVIGSNYADVEECKTALIQERQDIETYVWADYLNQYGISSRYWNTETKWEISCRLDTTGQMPE